MAKDYYLLGEILWGMKDYFISPDEEFETFDADYFWYEIGDVISIGDYNMLYYCFPKNSGDIVAKTRLATEEMFKLAVENRKKQLIEER